MEKLGVPDASMALEAGSLTDYSVRKSDERDRGAIEALYPDAFAEEHLLPVVRAHLRDPSNLPSLVAVQEDASASAGVIDHIAFTHWRLEDRDAKLALLAPLAVAIRVKKHGVSAALIWDGVARLRSMRPGGERPQASGVLQIPAMRRDPALWTP